MVRNRNARFVRTFIFALTCIAIALQLSSVMFRYGEYQLRRVSDRNAMIPSPPNEEISTIFAQLFPAAMCGLTILNIGSKLQNTAPRGALIAIAVSACFYGAAAMLDYVEFFARTSTSNSTGSAEYNEVRIKHKSEFSKPIFKVSILYLHNCSNGYCYHFGMCIICSFNFKICSRNSSITWTV